MTTSRRSRRARRKKRGTALIPRIPDFIEVSRTPYTDEAKKRAQDLRDQGYKTRLHRAGPFKDWRICRSINKREVKPPKPPKEKARRGDPAQLDILSS